MHPVIRIITFLIIAILLARAHPMQMGWVLSVIALAFIIESGKGLREAIKLLWRVRWLLLSILMIYVWIPIGTMTESLWQAAHRMALLAIMLFALQALVLNMQRRHIVSGLYILLFPFQLLGLSRERLVMRLILTMDSVKQLPEILSMPAEENIDNTSRLKRLTERFISALARTLSYADSATHEVIRVDTDNDVPLWQWLAPIFVVLIFYSLSR